jgi:hypothetical protein
MLVSLAAAVLLTAALQSSSPDRTEAEHLARAGQTDEALRLFLQIAERNAEDLEARAWAARLALRLGRTADAEAWFRSVLHQRPQDVDALIGLGMTLTRRGEWQQALAILREAEPVAGENADLFGALARAYRRAGDDRRALDYFRRATALAPGDPDVVSGFEAVARVYGHSIAVEGFGEQGVPGAEAVSGSLAADLRVTPALHLQGTVRVLERSGTTDVVAGGGVVWRLARATTAGVRGAGGSGNISLPTSEVAAEVVHVVGLFEIGAGLRRMSYAGAGVTAVSPVLSWDTDLHRIDGRYSYSRSRFDDTGKSPGDHSVLVRETWRAWRRASINIAYAYGIESFENLTVDRLGSLRTTTLAGGLQFRLPSLTTLTTTWEHQWRSNDTAIDRLTVSIVQSLP